MATKLEILKTFKRLLVEFFDDLRTILPHEQDLLMLRIFFNDQAPTLDVMVFFIRKLLPHREMIRLRNDKFFLHNDALFQHLHQKGKSGSIEHFKDLWQSNTLDDQDKQAVWAWYDKFVQLADLYRKHMTCDELQHFGLAS